MTEISFQMPEKMPIEVFPCVRNIGGLLISPDMGIWLQRNAKGFDLIHMHDSRTYQNVLSYKVAKKHRIPYLFHAHGTLPRRTGKRLLKWVYDVAFGYRILRNVSKAIALSDVEAHLYEEMKVPRERITIVPNGVDLDEYANLPSRGGFAERYLNDDNARFILYLGRLHKTKGLDFLVKGFAIFAKRNENARLVIAGPDDGYLGALKKITNQAGVNKKVVFTGKLTEYDKKSAMVDSTLVAYLGCYEPFGLVPLEAALCCRPVVVCSNTPMARIVQDGMFGFTVDYGNVTQLATIMQRLFSDDSYAGALGHKGRTYVRERYDWKKIARKVESIYGEILGICSTQGKIEN